MTTTHAVGTTATEAEVLAATQAAIAAGNDPFGDDDDDDDDGTPAAATDDGANANDQDANDSGDGSANDGTDDAAQVESDSTQGDADDLSADALAAVAGDDDAPAEPAETRFKAQSPAEFAEARKELLDKRAKAFKDYADGVIEPEEYSRIDSEVFDGLEALTVQRTLFEANTQRDAQTADQVLSSIMEAAKTAGEVDYATDAQAAKRFDLEMQLLAGDGVKRTYAQAAALAHKNVLAVRGIVPKPVDDPKPEPAKPRANGKPPITLRDVPSAAVANTGGGWQEQMGKLSGQEYEDAFARLTPAQQAQARGD